MQPTPRNKRGELRRTIERNVHRFPEPWREVLLPKLHVDPDGLEDGLLVRAWAVGTLEKLLDSLWPFVDFCRERGLPEALTRETLRQRLSERQALFKAGCVMPASVLRELESLYALAKVAEPQRDWSWMNAPIAAFKRLAPLYPSRANTRLVELVELKILARETGEVALQAHRKVKSHKARIMAMTKARTGLAIALLVNSPVRVGSLARLDLERHFDRGFTTFSLSATETKDRKRDVRRVPPELRDHLLSYVKHHRAIVANPKDTHLLLGERGQHLTSEAISDDIGNLTERHMGTRVSAHMIRNVIASFIVSEAPEEAALATTILNHRSPSTTEPYRANANQVTAGRRMLEATRTAQSAVARPNRSAKSPRRPRRPTRPATD